MNTDNAQGADELTVEEQQQFAEWLSRQDPSRRGHYMKLAQAYGFQAEEETSS
ncbi:MAG: hypothetical protein PHP44_03550 [Kiritimatiellae bacterium]|nr:hypothetical protein [Kiritimatiellia bacterium]MDD4735165.1 hypothetical protein [Kiritimatiellia bacterium]